MSSHVAHDYDDPSASPRLCQNCAAVLRGPYCAKCGQHDIDYHRSFYHLTHDLLENLFHFEGKFLVSMAWLLAKPGRLTAEFVAGRRASQINPLRFYIFVTVLFFLGVHLLNHGHLFAFDRKKAEVYSAKMRQTLDGAAKQAEGLSTNEKAEVARRVGEIAGKKQGNIEEKEIQAIIATVRDEFAGRRAPAAPESPPRGKSTRVGGGPGTPSLTVRDDNLGKALSAKIRSGDLTLTDIFDAIEAKVPTILFLGMPLCALLLKALYWRSKRYYVEHLILSVHLHTWVFLVVIVSWGYFKLGALLGSWATRALLFALLGWMAWYLFRSFRVVYAQGRLKTGLKMAMLGVSYFFVLSFLAVGVIYATVAWLAA